MRFKRISELISVTLHESYPVIIMKWYSQAQHADIQAAFNEVTLFLDNAEQSLCVIVDLSECSQMRMLHTIQAALRGAYSHPNLRQWLVIGKNTWAKAVENVLAHTTGQRRVTWIDTYKDAIQCVEEHYLT